jgi:UDP-glucose 4-epimerase
MSKKVLVTGGAGFIGSHIVGHLVNDGYNVRILDNLTTGKLSNIQEHLDSENAEFIKGDIQDPSVTKKSLENIDVVIHLAALVSVPLSVQNPELTFNINLSGTLNLLRLSTKEKIEKFVFVSSCAVCGNPTTLPVTEETPTNPLSPYAESKLLGERYCLGFSERQLLPSTVLRFFNVYGLRQGINDYSGVITRFIECCRKGVSLKIYGDGSQTRDFVNVGDVAQAVLATVKSSKVTGETFNIGSGKSTSIKELAETILRLADVNLEVYYESPRLGDVKASYADISKAQRQLGYEPHIALPEGLQSLLNSQETD